jgi:hypothetical protein
MKKIILASIPEARRKVGQKRYSENKGFSDLHEGLIFKRNSLIIKMMTR